MVCERFRHSDDIGYDNLVSYPYSDSQNKQRYEGAKVHGVGKVFDHESPKEKQTDLVYLTLRDGEGEALTLKNLKLLGIETHKMQFKAKT